MRNSQLPLKVVLAGLLLGFAILPRSAVAQELASVAQQSAEQGRRISRQDLILLGVAVIGVVIGRIGFSRSAKNRSEGQARS